MFQSSLVAHSHVLLLEIHVGKVRSHRHIEVAGPFSLGVTHESISLGTYFLISKSLQSVFLHRMKDYNFFRIYLVSLKASRQSLMNFEEMTSRRARMSYQRCRR